MVQIQGWLRFCLVVGIMLCMPVAALAGDVVYNKYNIHVYEYTDRNGMLYKASYAGFIDPPVSAQHFIIAPGEAFVVGKWRQGFSLTNKKDGKKIHYEFNRRNMKMTTEEYIQLITSGQRQKPQGLTKLDRKGVKAGKALVGMTRTGVLTALGYPAKHKTASLEAKYWTYWKDRWRKLGVEFGANGKVARVVE